MASLEVVLVVTAGGVGCYWHLLGRGWRCCSRSSSAQDSPTTKSDLAQSVHSAEVEKSQLRFSIVPLSSL